MFMNERYKPCRSRVNSRKRASPLVLGQAPHIKQKNPPRGGFSWSISPSASARLAAQKGGDFQMIFLDLRRAGPAVLVQLALRGTCRRLAAHRRAAGVGGRAGDDARGRTFGLARGFIGLGLAL